jgi:hypothetical protein
MRIEIAPDDMPSPERRAELQQRIRDVWEFGARELNAWERQFLTDVEAQLGNQGLLTRGQRQKLSELYAEHVDPEDSGL